MTAQETASLEAAPPVAAGDRITLDIDSLTHDGEGVGRRQGFAVFVPGSLPGDQVTARVLSVRKSYGRALMEELVRSAPARISPPCPVYAACGACQLQHLDYAAQLEQKRQWVREALTRIGKLTGVSVHPTLPMKDPWRYRNKGQFPVASREGHTVSGCFRQSSHEVVDVQDCLIQHPLNNLVRNTVRDLADSYHLSAYDRDAKGGLLSHVLVRTGRQTAESLAIIVTGDEAFPAGKMLAAELMQLVPQVIGVIWQRRSASGGDKMTLLGGRGYLTDELSGLKFRISAEAFFQVNPLQAETLFQTAVRYAGLTGEERVIDACCGVGAISLFLAAGAKSVIGIESSLAAVADARGNAQVNGIGNVRFLAGNAGQVIASLKKREGIQADVVLVDPPRTGCDKGLLSSLALMQPERIVYVSCDAGTLARDLAFLTAHGYRVREVQPIDMFPQTAHVETVVLMSRVKE